MKAVLISIQPKWCNLIAKGKKTVEVRKTKPKLETPFKCYIYQTKGLKDNEKYGFKTWARSGKVIGEFVCDKIEEMERDVNDWLPKHRYDIAPKLLKATCLTEEQLWNYGDSRMLYGWHISELKIYHKAKELREFYKDCNKSCVDCKFTDDCDFVSLPDYEGNGFRAITRPPQSWCYVED